MTSGQQNPPFPGIPGLGDQLSGEWLPASGHPGGLPLGDLLNRGRLPEACNRSTLPPEGSPRKGRLPATACRRILRAFQGCKDRHRWGQSVETGSASVLPRLKRCILLAWSWCAAKSAASLAESWNNPGLTRFDLRLERHPYEKPKSRNILMPSRWFWYDFGILVHALNSGVLFRPGFCISCSYGLGTEHLFVGSGWVSLENSRNSQDKALHPRASWCLKFRRSWSEL